MKMPHAVVIAAALISVAILAREAWTQQNSTPFTVGVVVTTCGTPPWTYTVGSTQPITIESTTGLLCNKI
jgi:1,4-dihydroxy-2-naphthoate octaprenyltransferase